MKNMKEILLSQLFDGKIECDKIIDEYLVPKALNNNNNGKDEIVFQCKEFIRNMIEISAEFVADHEFGTPPPNVNVNNSTVSMKERNEKVVQFVKEVLIECLFPTDFDTDENDDNNENDNGRGVVINDGYGGILTNELSSDNINDINNRNAYDEELNGDKLSKEIKRKENEINEWLKSAKIANEKIVELVNKINMAKATEISKISKIEKMDNTPTDENS